MRVSRSVQWGEMKGMQKVETVEQMPDEYRDVLLKIIHALASTEFASVEQHQPWLNRGPTAEDRFIQAQIAADEAHQGFIDSRLLRSFGDEGAAMADDLMTKKMGEHALDAFNVPFESWSDVVGFCFCLDLVAWHHLHAMENCSYAPLAREMTSMVHEERFHASFGARRAGDLARNAAYQSAAGSNGEEMQASIDKWYPRALDTFGRSGSKFSNLSVTFGIRRWNNEDLRALYKTDIDEKIAGIGLEIPPEDRDRRIF